MQYGNLSPIRIKNLINFLNQVTEGRRDEIKFHHQKTRQEWDMFLEGISITARIVVCPEIPYGYPDVSDESQELEMDIRLEVENFMTFLLM